MELNITILLLQVCTIQISRAECWREGLGTPLDDQTSLARLLTYQDKRNERAILPEIYNWFTEGTPDLKDAKALLDELST